MISNCESKTSGLSIIVPFFNEEKGIELFCRTLDKYVLTLDFSVELIFVNDGSTDNTTNVLSSYVFENIDKVKLIELSKNYGSHSAIRAGILKSNYEICTWIGSDLQEPLELIPISYNKIFKEGYDAVYIEKKTVKVSKANRFFSRIYSNLIKKFAVKNYSGGGISTIVFNSKIKELLNNNIEANSSIILQIMDAGFNYYHISLDYGERAAGKSKWTFTKKIKLLVDSFVSFSFMPIRLVSIVGIIIFIFGIIFGIITIVNKIINPIVPAGYSTLVSIIAIGFGITNISLGIIAEYLWRTFEAARKRPVFNVSREIVVKDRNIT